MFSAKEEVNAPSSNVTKCSETVIIHENHNRDDTEDITNAGTGEEPYPMGKLLAEFGNVAGCRFDSASSFSEFSFP